MYLEGITVCVGYADFLAAILPNNLQHLDHLVVVTDSKDYKTKKLCRFYNATYKITLVETDAFYEEGAKFNKGAGLREGMKALRQGDWVVHFDSDIWFSPHLRSILNVCVNKGKLDYRCLYGLDRMMCTSYESWQKFLLHPSFINHEYYLASASAFPIHSRVTHYQEGEYYPVGYFQLWHPSSTGVHTYPDESDGADRTDMVFAKRFKKRRLLEHTFVIHLDSEPAPAGTNWWGRKTRPFMPAELYTAAGVVSELSGAVLKDGVFQEPATVPSTVVPVVLGGEQSAPQKPTSYSWVDKAAYCVVLLLSVIGGCSVIPLLS